MDTYSKIVMTVIALALSVHALHIVGVIPAQAQQGAVDGITKVQICGFDSWIPNKTSCTGVNNGALMVKP